MYVCMCVHMYVCMYVCTYVCVYVCMYVCNEEFFCVYEGIAWVQLFVRYFGLHYIIIHHVQ